MMECPCKKTSPSKSGFNPASARSSVLLPQPEAPMMTVSWPAGRANDIGSSRHFTPKEGTRVRLKPDGNVEFMPSFEELESLLAAIDPRLAEGLLSVMQNKPQKRKDYCDNLNAQYHKSGSKS
jgi:hypothetical protein